MFVFLRDKTLFLYAHEPMSKKRVFEPGTQMRTFDQSIALTSVSVKYVFNNSISIVLLSINILEPLRLDSIE